MDDLKASLLVAVDGTQTPVIPSSAFFSLILPALVSAYLVAFVLSFDEIVVASFIAGDTTTFPLYLFSQLRFPTLLPQMLAVACVVMLVSALVLIGAEVARRVLERRLGADLAAPPPAEPA